MYYLYLKTHNKTKLRYLGQTKQNPYTYIGSGKYWKRHIKIHGEDIQTEILLETESADELKVAGVFYSNLFDIVGSLDFANLKIECGDGGFDHINRLPKEQRKEMFRNWWAKLSQEEKNNINKKKLNFGKNNGMYGRDRSGENNGMYGKKHSEETKNKIGEANRGKNHGMYGVKGECHPNFGRTQSMETTMKRSTSAKERNIKPPSSKGMLWFNNGVLNIRRKDHPGENWNRGRLS